MYAHMRHMTGAAMSVKSGLYHGGSILAIANANANRVFWKDMKAWAFHRAPRRSRWIRQ